MCLADVSVRREEDITEALWDEKVRPSTVSMLNQKIHGKIEEWLIRPIIGEYPGYPDYASLMQVMQMGEVHVCFVKDDDFSDANRLAQSPRHFRIGVFRAVHNGKIRKK